MDKPNASLSGDRRGTLSYPDLESFDLQRPSKKSKRERLKKSNKDYTYDIDRISEEESVADKSKRSKRNTKKSIVSANAGSEDEEEKVLSVSLTPNPYCRDNGIQDNQSSESKERDDSEFDEAYSYPHKKYYKREAFLSTWKDGFSRQWDAV